MQLCDLVEQFVALLRREHDVLDVRVVVAVVLGVVVAPHRLHRVGAEQGVGDERTGQAATGAQRGVIQNAGQGDEQGRLQQGRRGASYKTQGGVTNRAGCNRGTEGHYTGVGVMNEQGRLQQGCRGALHRGGGDEQGRLQQGCRGAGVTKRADCNRLQGAQRCVTQGTWRG